MKSEPYYLWRALYVGRGGDHAFTVVAATDLHDALRVFDSREPVDATLIEVKRGRRLYGWHEMEPSDHRAFIDLASIPDTRRLGWDGPNDRH